MTAFLPAWAVWLTAPKVPPHHLYDRIEIDIKVKVWHFHSELGFLRITCNTICNIKLKLKLKFKVKVWAFSFLGRVPPYHLCTIKLKLELFGIFILSFVSVFEIFDRVSDS